MLIKGILWILIFTIFTLITTSYCETTENEATDIDPSEESSETNSTMPSILDATASKLVRYRIKRPVNYYRYKTQTFKRPRPRVKIPKRKYNPAMHSISEPTSYYKQQPEIYTSTQSYKPTYKPSYNSYEEVHYEVSSEYPVVQNIPLSNYEAHAMDLKFYEDSHPKKKAPQYEYQKPKKTTPSQRPHKVYGVPKETAYNSYDSYSGDDYKTQYVSKPEVQYDVSYHEEPPKQNYGPPPHQKEEYEHFPPYGAPPKPRHQPEHVSYQVPNNKYEAPISSYHPHEQSSQGGPYPASNNKYEAPGSSYHPHEQPSNGVQYTDQKYEAPMTSYHPHEEPANEGPYPVYDKKLPNVGYHNHFAEPPADIHITYSPSYEINPLPPKHHPPPQNTYEAPLSENYGPPTNSYDYNQKSNSDYQTPSDSYHQSNGGHFAEPPGSYLPPVHHQDELPLKKNHMPPGYDYPKSSYEVPLYDPIPFESTTADQDYFPPNHHIRAPQHEHEHVSESNNNIQQIPPQSHPPNPASSATTTTTTTVALEPVPEANNKVHRFTPHHNYRSNHVNRQESSSKFPVAIEDSQTSDAPSSKYLDKILSTTSIRPRRKRKRTKPPVTEKHNLDAPELKIAFESGHDQSEEPTALSSNIKESVNTGRQNVQNKSPVQVLTEFSPSQSWNPMRIRTKPPTTPQRGQRITENALNELKNIEVVSIEKSQSHSYYAGTIPPRTRNLNSRADAAQKDSVRATTFRAEDVVQPTRSLVIDKTYFKVKDDEGDFYDGTGELPKNHKLF